MYTFLCVGSFWVLTVITIERYMAIVRLKKMTLMSSYTLVALGCFF